MKVSRRSLLVNSAAAASVSVAGVGPATMQTGQDDQPDEAEDAGGARAGARTWPSPSLKALAAAKGMRFGSSFDRQVFQHPVYAQALKSEAAVLTPESGFYWSTIRPTMHSFDFLLADRLAGFANSNGMALRGHALVWHKVLAPGFDASTKSVPAMKQMERHINAVAGYYKDRVESWVVVNEAIQPTPDRADGLRDGAFLREAGPDYIAAAFKMAHAAAPNAELVYNDWFSMTSSPFAERRRTALLKLIDSLKASGAPVHAIGLQSHLHAGKEVFAEGIWRDFCARIRSAGLTVHLTELDVGDEGLPADPARRDPAIADYARRYLDVTLGSARVRDVTVWGMTDRYSILDRNAPRSDGLMPRGAPYDSDFNAKPLRQAIAAALQAAPAFKA